jgi:hypothetical protein
MPRLSNKQQNGKEKIARQIISIDLFPKTLDVRLD